MNYSNDTLKRAFGSTIQDTAQKLNANNLAAVVFVVLTVDESTCQAVSGIVAQGAATDERTRTILNIAIDSLQTSKIATPEQEVEPS